MANGTVITGTTNGSSIIEVDPISRIEGHLGIKVAISGGKVSEADAHGNLWRGFENFLLGRDVNDAITFTQRICGVCPVPHGLTSTYAADSVLGYSRSHITFADTGETAGTYGVPAKAVLIRNLVLSSEFLMSSITHFYHLAAPSYVQGPAIPPWTPYFNDTYYFSGLQSLGHGTDATAAASTSGTRGVAPRATAFGTSGAAFSKDLWSTVIRSYVTALRIRRLTFEAGALFAGRMPMTSCFIGGGVTFSGTESLTTRCTTFKNIMKEVGEFIIKEYVPIALALGYMYPTFDNTVNGPVGAGTPAASACGVGAGLGNFLAWGAFPDTTSAGTLALHGGVRLNGASANVFTATNKATVISEFLTASGNSVPENLTESIAHSRYAQYPADSAAYDASGAAYPGNISRTVPARAEGYSYIKAPRWDGNAMEVGPLARLVVSNYYPVDGTLLALHGSLSTPYLGYTQTFTSASAVAVAAGGVFVPAASAYFGLDPRMIAPDIAVALVHEGLAAVYTRAGAAVTDPDAILAAYGSGNAVITGAIASWVIGLKGGLSTMDRLRARALESLVLVQAMIGGYNKATGAWGSGWIDTLSTQGGVTWNDKNIPTGVKSGWGATEAPRGALMHQVTINNGKITKYQCIVPTTWNGSPKDFAGQRGAIEQACIGAPYATLTASTGISGGNGAAQCGTEVLRIAQSFDPCIACAVH
ncbi:MAG: nickel-dependent hydrogenase large subunit [Actinobacteria bacterium]|nr:nickel-dependent hydrogenase large subunit [Actinomycetota bacterium]